MSGGLVLSRQFRFLKLENKVNDRESGILRLQMIHTIGSNGIKCSWRAYYSFGIQLQNSSKQIVLTVHIGENTMRCANCKTELLVLRREWKGGNDWIETVAFDVLYWLDMGNY